MSGEARRIEPQFYSKIWGTPRIGPWFEPRGDEAIGEVWFPADDLLIKFLFTSANLSVQVHPDDDYARRQGNPRGKTEMWHILRADPGAKIALGFKREVTGGLIPSAESGEIMDLLQWIEVHPGETYFVPSGTVHAIGAGLALCEIQQNSDVTYRLFDYGRKRELHLEQAEEVACLGPHPGRSIPRELGGGLQLLVECPYFRTYSASAGEPGRLAPDIDIRVAVVLEGSGRVDGQPARPGSVLMAEPHQWLVMPDEVQDQPAAGPMKFLLIA